MMKDERGEGRRLDYADYKVVRPKNCESETREKDLQVICEMFLKFRNKFSLRVISFKRI